MAKITGRDGVVRFLNSTVLQTRSWSIDEVGDTAELSTMGSSARGFLAAINSWSGSLDIYYDVDDAAIIDNAKVGVVVHIEVYPSGMDTPAPVVLEGSCIITGIAKGAAYDGMIETTISFQGSGILERNMIK